MKRHGTGCFGRRKPFYAFDIFGGPLVVLINKLHSEGLNELNSFIIQYRNAHFWHLNEKNIDAASGISE